VLCFVCLSQNSGVRRVRETAHALSCLAIARSAQHERSARTLIGTYNNFKVFAFEVIVRLFLLSSMILWFMVAATLPSASQGNPLSFPQGPMQAKPGPEDEPRQKLERDMAKKANQDRQANLKRDTEKLLKLSTELKEYVDKTNENMLSVEVVKKAEEIEKLAHSVKDKMKGSN
jgi:hypothetical protein